MSGLKKIMDGFAKDENGKFVIIPRNLSAFTQCSSSNEKQPTSVKRKRPPILPITPIQLSNFEELEPAVKKNKNERPVRKELFKGTQRLSGSRRSSNTRRTINKNQTSTTKPKNFQYVTKKPVKQVALNDGSPLLDVDEAEQLLCQKGPRIIPTKTVLFPMAPIKEETTKDSPIKTLLPQIDVTPTSSLESELEFLQLEKTLASVTKSARKMVDSTSPVTSVCTLLQKTRIAQSPAPNTVSTEVLNLVKESRDQIQSLKQQFDAQIQSLQKQFNASIQEHETRLTGIIQLLEASEENKENTSRRSIRIATQSDKKFNTSPAISKKMDLRKSTLNKNLSRNLQCDSPRMQKAVDMYNTIRTDFSVLCTPKLDRTNIDLPQASVTRSLSRRIQKQCLMLQDTPKQS